MKKHSYIIIALHILLFALIGNNVKAQQQICGNDTIILSLTNFHYGSIQWEESSDSVNWVTIPNAVDTFYKFFPEKSKYYRAVGITADCPPTYSDVTFVAKPVIASAGTDRVLIGTKLFLAANSLRETTGTWSILNGTGGAINEFNNPYTEFTGIKNNTYTLIWTLTNVCGSYADTVNIKFTENTYRNNWVIVDSTDNILSDSTQRANGFYNIIFTTPVPSITDTTVLIGLIGEGFLQKVVSFTKNADTFFIQTQQAYLTDFIINGALNFAPGLYPNTTLSRSGISKGISIGKYPTRKDLLNNTYTDGEIIYQSTIIEHLANGLTIQNNNSRNDNPREIKLTFLDLPIYDDKNNDNSIKLSSGSITIQPNFFADLDIEWGWEGWLYRPKLKVFNFGLDNAKIEYTFGPEISFKNSCIKKDYSTSLWKYKKLVIFLAGGAPIPVTVDIDFKATFSIDVSGEVTASIQITKSTILSSSIQYNPVTKEFINSKNKTEEVKFNNKLNINASIEQSFSIGPEIKAKLFGIVGGYVDFELLKEELTVCFNNSSNWDVDLNISTDITVGALAELKIDHVIDKEFFKTESKFSFGWYKYVFPYELNKISGENQQGYANQNLPNPIIIRVISSNGAPVPFVPVRFETTDGSVSNSVVYSDINGLAQVSWEIANKTGAQTLKAFVFDCENDDINNSPITIYASIKDDAFYDCSKSSLSLKLLTNGTDIIPSGVNGVPPYQYSKDGTNYSATLKEVLIYNKTYSYFVKDLKGCISSKSYTHTANNCLNSTLVLNLSTKVNTITAQATGGLPPYQYSLANANNFSTNNQFINLANGSYKIFAKDANNCMVNTTANINIQPDNLPTVTTSSITNITLTTASSGGVVSLTGGFPVIARGVCWSTSQNPDINGSHTSNGSGIGGFTSNITGLAANTLYYVRAYAINNKGTAYGNELSFTTTNSITITTVQIPAGTFTMGSPTSEVGRGSGEAQYQVTLSAFKLSKYEITNAQFATFLNAKSIGSNGLYTAGAYPAQALVYASSGSTDWGLHYSAGQWIPVASNENNPVVKVTWYGATEFATYAGGRLPTEAEWEYACRGNTSTPFNTGACLTDVQANYTWASSYSTCTNTNTTSPGKTQAVGTYAANAYGLYDMHGNVWEWCSDWYGTYPTTAQTNPTGAGGGSYRILRGGGWGYGAQSCRSAIRFFDGPSTSYHDLGFRVVFASGSSIIVTDFDGNVYDTVRIGTQTWLKQNLKTTHYRNGDTIPNVTDSATWIGLTKGAYCNYNNDPVNSATYGRLYNWYTLNDSRKICPTGWHVPTGAEWTTLENYLEANGYNYDGTTSGNKYAKALASTTGWTANTGTGTIGNNDYPAKRNVTGFTAFPAGSRSSGMFLGIGYYGNWWRSDGDFMATAYYRSMGYTSSSVDRYNYGDKTSGFSVRCLKDY